jgi:hypothetical protein
MEGGKSPSVGSKCTTTRRIGGTAREVTSEITKLDPPTSWAVHGIDGPIRAIVNVSVPVRLTNGSLKHAPAWRHIRELHAKRFGRAIHLDDV